MIKQQLSQKFQQKFSPQQIQQAKLLALTSLEIENRIERELEENPLLEEIPNAIPTIEIISEKKDSVDNFFTNYSTQRNTSFIFNQWAMNYSESESFHEYLLAQWRLKTISKKEMYIGEYLIGNMDNDGYIRLDVQTLADDISISYRENIQASTISKTLQLIQELDPPGIGANHLQECLLLQLNRKKITPIREKTIYVLKKHFDLLAKRHYDSISKIAAISKKELKEIIKEITHLNPRPGNMWETPTDKWIHIIPDFIVETKDNTLTFKINGETTIPYLKVNQEYSKLFKNRYLNNQEAINFIKQRTEDAQWFVTAIKQRHLILYHTMVAIVEIQHRFFLTGKEKYLNPMRLKDISKKCNYDISTISRATFNKYVQTEWGIFPLRFFFSDSMQTNDGKIISTRTVKAMLKSLIKSENTDYPLTDEILANILEKKGYKVARRTVAKYREQLNIPVARLRKKMN